MDGQRARLAARRFDRATTIPPAVAPAPERPERAVPAPPDPRTPEAGQLPTRWAGAIGIGWPLAIIVGMALEPQPADPTAAPSALVELASLALFVALVGTAIAAGVRHRAAAVGGVVTGVLTATFSITCPVSGHHAIGLWWFAQLGIVIAMLAVSATALLHTRR